MRRKDRECADTATIYAILDKAEVLYLAMPGETYPYCLPVNFARDGSRIYIHSALAGAKLDYIRRDANIAFSTAIDIRIDTERFTTYYKSVCGNGKARIIEDETEKGNALDLIGARYNALCPRPAPEKNIRRVCVIRIDIDHITGKIHAEPQEKA